MKKSKFIEINKKRKGKTLEEIYGKVKANEIRKKLSRARKGKPLSEKNKIGISKALKGRNITWGDKISTSLKNSEKFKNSFLTKKVPNFSGKNNPFYNKKHTEKTKKVMSEIKSDEKHPCWKGDNVGYDALHAWIRKNKPKPNKCEECNKNIPRDLANISGEYRRDVNDFKWLCRKCHVHYDNIYEKRKKQMRISRGYK